MPQHRRLDGSPGRRHVSACIHNMIKVDHLAERDLLLRQYQHRRRVALPGPIQPCVRPGDGAIHASAESGRSAGVRIPALAAVASTSGRYRHRIGSSRRSGGCWRAKAAVTASQFLPGFCIRTSNDPADRAQDTAAPGGQRLQVRSQLTGGARPSMRTAAGTAACGDLAERRQRIRPRCQQRQRADARRVARAHNCESRGLLSGRASQVSRGWGVSSLGLSPGTVHG
jgi:hypothetical protein